jgi:hypothetical protein
MRPLLTHCKWGHPYSGDNLLINAKGRRVCRACRDKRTTEWNAANPEKRLKIFRDSYHKHKDDNPEHKKARNFRSGIRRRFGITADEYAAKLAAQNNLCAMCGKPFDYANEHTRPHLDHNHKTGALRDFIHGRCNLGIGHFLDDPALCRKAEEYLLRHKETPCPPDTKKSETTS